jgi:methanogenic corrinoid protein MtbC1
MLGIRIVALWLVSKGVRAHAVDRPLNVEDILALVRTRQPRYLLVSVALAEQRESVVAIAERIAALPARTRPKIIVGGNAVKLGFVRDIPNCDLIADLGSLILATAEQNAPH